MSTRTLRLSYESEYERGNEIHKLRMSVSGGYMREIFLRKGYEDVLALKTFLEDNPNILFDLSIEKNGVRALKRIRIEQLVKYHNNAFSLN